MGAQIRAADFPLKPEAVLFPPGLRAPCRFGTMVAERTCLEATSLRVSVLGLGRGLVVSSPGGFLPAPTLASSPQPRAGDHEGSAQAIPRPLLEEGTPAG